MSERKTTEIKLRVSPAEKTAWQVAADEEGIGLSEFARRAMNARIGRESKKAEAEQLLAAATGLAVVNNKTVTTLGHVVGVTPEWPVTLSPEDDHAGRGAASGRLAWIDKEPYASLTLVDYASHALSMAKSRGESIEDYRLALHAVSTPEDDFPVAQDVPTSSEVDLVDTLGPAIAAEVRGEEPKSWMFEARSGD